MRMICLRRVGVCLLGAALYMALPNSARAEGDSWKGTSQETFLKSALVKKYQCFTCHTITDTGGTVGPILNMSGLRREKEWIRTWLKDPNAIKPGTKMPMFPFSAQELDQVVNFLSRMKRPLHTQEIINSSKSPVEKGRALFKDYDCSACHRIGDQGRFVGPDLTFVGLRKTEQWEQVWLKDPTGFKPGAFMPNFHIPKEGILHLAAFLHTLQGQENEAGRLWEFMINFMIDNRDVQRGEMVWKRMGCWGCHGEAGKGGIKSQNAAAGHETVPGLKEVRDKYSKEDFFKKVSTGTQVPAVSKDAVPQPYACPAYPEDALNRQDRDDLWAYISSLAPRKSKWKVK